MAIAFWFKPHLATMRASRNSSNNQPPCSKLTGAPWIRSLEMYQCSDSTGEIISQLGSLSGRDPFNFQEFRGQEQALRGSWMASPFWSHSSVSKFKAAADPSFCQQLQPWDPPFHGWKQLDKLVQIHTNNPSLGYHSGFPCSLPFEFQILYLCATISSMNYLSSEIPFNSRAPSYKDFCRRSLASTPLGSD